MLAWTPSNLDESLRPDFEEGRWVVTARHRRRAWEIVVEPDAAEGVLVVITAYPVVRGRGP